jgi:hypothetical protein
MRSKLIQSWQLGPFVTVDPNPEAGVIGPNITFKNVNIHVINGLGQTGLANGLGNLIIGYDENPGVNPGDRSGSHNLIVGPWNRFNSNALGAVCFGANNAVGEVSTAIVGGWGNATVNGSDYSIILGGENNYMQGQYSTISGGENNRL